MKKTRDIVLIVALAVLIVFSVLQSTEIAALKDSGASPGEAAKTSAKTSSAGSYSLPGNLENLESMVGGC